jgi:predicted PolB exonuclease-like 3'-5' exonuclease
MSEDRILAFDLETVADVRAFAVAEGLERHPDWEVRRQMGDKVARQIFQRIVCIGSLAAQRGDNGAWEPVLLDAPHLGQNSEQQLIRDFVERVAVLGPRLVTFNGHAFDLPVLRYRAMMHGVAAPGLGARPYFDRAATSTVDLCDLLSAGERHARVSLQELARVLGLPGKPAGIDGSRIETFVNERRFVEIADYCRADVVNTYRAWLRYELFCGRLSKQAHGESEAMLDGFLDGRS